MSERFSLISGGDVATSAKYGKPRSTHSLIWRLSATQTPSRSSRSPSEPASASRRALEEIVADSNYLSPHPRPRPLAFAHLESFDGSLATRRKNA